MPSGMIRCGCRFYVLASRRLKILARPYATQKPIETKVKYTDTINLPKTNFPARLSAAKRASVENEVLKKCAGLYNYQREIHKEPEFILHDGPPYANGDLHMGHVVNKVLKDITSRSRVVECQKVHYKPGWDCHGLPIELKAMHKHKSSDALEIRKASRSFASKTIQQQQTEFKSWAVMADWENTSNKYQTFDASYITNQLEMFLDFYEKGYIYRDVKPVYWSPSSRSALAEAELEYNPNFVSPSILLRLPLVNKPNELSTIENIYAVIWTTTPWTLPANQAICYNPDLTYNVVKICQKEDENFYIVAADLIKDFEEKTQSQLETIRTFTGDKLHGATYIHPFNKDEILPLLPASHVQSSKGTGLVHTAPAHGPEDFLVSLQNGIKVKNLVGGSGKYTAEAPSFLKSKLVLEEGNEIVLNYLQDSLLFSGKITHSYPIDWRTKKPIILRASEQWFINTEKLKQKAIAALDSIKIYPKAQSDINRKILITQLEKRPYWCISRQRVWGVPIPVFYDKSTQQPIVNKKIVSRLCSLIDQEGNADFWWSKNVDEILGKELINEMSLDRRILEKGEDILDIWFDSGVSWSYALGKNSVADVYLEGLDQFTGWFQSSLLTSVAARGVAPYKTIFVHGFAVDEKGHKMSKSLGNIIYPKEIIEKYGVDAMRWWVASHATQNASIIVSNHLMQAAADYLNKLRAILKYHLGIVGRRQKDDHTNSSAYKLSYLDKYFLSELTKVEQEVCKFYQSFEYNRVTTLIQNFVNNHVSSLYLHLIKDRLYCGSDEDFLTVRYVLLQSMNSLCKMLWPITPTLIEEGWSYYDEVPFYENSINTNSNWVNNDVEKIMNTVNSLREFFHQQVKDVNTWTLNVVVTTNDDNFNDLEMLQSSDNTDPPRYDSSELCELMQVNSITLQKDSSIKPGNVWNIKVESTENELCPRCRRFAIRDSEDVCCRCTEILKTKTNL